MPLLLRWSAIVRHDLVVEGEAFRLRPVEVKDAAFILHLRTDPELSRYVHPVSGRLEDQEAWIRDYGAREDDWYWIVARRFREESEGTIGLYDLQRDFARAEWGRWILKRGSLAATESAWLLYRVAFEYLDLNEVYCRTLVKNAQVLSFHDSCGLRRTKELPGFFTFQGEPVDAVEHCLSRTNWPAVETMLRTKVARLAKMIGSAR